MRLNPNAPRWVRAIMVFYIVRIVIAAGALTNRTAAGELSFLHGPDALTRTPVIFLTIAVEGLVIVGLNSMRPWGYWTTMASMGLLAMIQLPTLGGNRISLLTNLAWPLYVVTFLFLKRRLYGVGGSTEAVPGLWFGTAEPVEPQPRVQSKWPGWGLVLPTGDGLLGSRKVALVLIGTMLLGQALQVMQRGLEGIPMVLFIAPPFIALVAGVALASRQGGIVLCTFFGLVYAIWSSVVYQGAIHPKPSGYGENFAFYVLPLLGLVPIGILLGAVIWIRTADTARAPRDQAVLPAGSRDE